MQNRFAVEHHACASRPRVPFRNNRQWLTTGCCMQRRSMMCGSPKRAAGVTNSSWSAQRLAGWQAACLPSLFPTSFHLLPHCMRHTAPVSGRWCPASSQALMQASGIDTAMPACFLHLHPGARWGRARSCAAWMEGCSNGSVRGCSCLACRRFPHQAPRLACRPAPTTTTCPPTCQPRSSARPVPALGVGQEQTP